MAAFRVTLGFIKNTKIVSEYEKVLSLTEQVNLAFAEGNKDIAKELRAKLTLQRKDVLEPEITRFFYPDEDQFIEGNMSMLVRPGKAGTNEPDAVAYSRDTGEINPRLSTEFKLLASQRETGEIRLGGTKVASDLALLRDNISKYATRRKRFADRVERLPLRELYLDSGKPVPGGTDTSQIDTVLSERFLTRQEGGSFKPVYTAIGDNDTLYKDFVRSVGYSSIYKEIIDQIASSEAKTDKQVSNLIVKGLQKLNSNRQLFGFLRKYYPEVYEGIEFKGRNVLITLPTRNNNLVPSAVISFTEPNFVNYSNFKIPKDSIESSEKNNGILLEVYLKTEIATKIRKALTASLDNAGTAILDRQVINLQQVLAKNYAKNTRIDKTTFKEFNGELVAGIWGFGKPASIPMGKVKAVPKRRKKYVFSSVPRRKKAAMQSRIEPIRSLLRETRPYTESISNFITDDTISALTKREMLRRMPIGPVGGPPLSGNVLTFRTGRFVNSVEVFTDQKNKQISYFYDPVYRIHEVTSRDPRNLIRSSISAVALSIFKQRFQIAPEYDITEVRRARKRNSARRRRLKNGNK